MPLPTTPAARHALHALAAAATAACLAACAATPPESVDYTAPRALDQQQPYSNRDRPVTTMLASSQSRANNAAAQGRLVQQLNFSTPQSTIDRALGNAPADTGPEQQVKLAFNNADAKDVIRIITSQYLGRGFIIDPSVTDRITMDIDQAMTLADVADLLAALARIYGWSIQETAGVLYVAKLDADSARSPLATIADQRPLVGGEAPILRVRRFNYVEPSAIDSMLAPFMSTNAVRESQGRLLIMIDTQSQIARAERIIDMLDVPPFQDVQILRYRLANTDAAAAVTLLTQLADQTGLSAGPGTNAALSFIQFPGSQDVLVMLRDPALAAAAADLVAQVDAPRGVGQRLRYIYNVQHYDTAQLRTLLTEFYADSIEQRAAANNTNARVQTTDRMRLSWDDDNGKLLVLATPEDYADLLATLRELDRAPQQVSISAVIAEVGLTNDLEYGVEYFLEGLDIEGFGSLDFTGGTGPLSGTPTGSAFFAGASGFAIIQALDTESDVNIISQPHVTVLDGGTAKIQVGGEVPISRGSVDTETGGLRQDIEYRDTGTTLDLQVRVNESGEVRLTVLKEIAAVGPDSELGPTFTTRELNTEVIVPHGRTLVLGGIIDSSNRDTVTRIPLLGDLPVLGLAFQSQRLEDRRTELLLTITPTIINNPYQADLMSQDFINSTRAVQAALHEAADQLPVGMLRPAGTFDQPDIAATQLNPGSQVEPFQLNPQPEQATPTPAPQQDPPPMPAFMEELLKSVGNQNSAGGSGNQR